MRDADSERYMHHKGDARPAVVSMAAIPDTIVSMSVLTRVTMAKLLE
jgi:hypothetical protein